MAPPQDDGRRGARGATHWDGAGGGAAAADPAMAVRFDGASEAWLVPPARVLKEDGNQFEIQFPFELNNTGGWARFLHSARVVCWFIREIPASLAFGC